VLRLRRTFVALSPDDISMTILTIQLLEQSRDEAALRRAAHYAARVLEFVERTSSGEKSPKISQEEWTIERKRDRMSVLTLRGRLELRLKDTVFRPERFRGELRDSPQLGGGGTARRIAELKKIRKAR